MNDVHRTQQRTKTPVRRRDPGLRGMGGVQGGTGSTLCWLHAMGRTERKGLPFAKAGQQRGFSWPKNRRDGKDIPSVPEWPRRGTEPIKGTRRAAQGNGAGKPCAPSEPCAAHHIPNSASPGKCTDPGRNVFVVGTNSLYLYEALAGVQVKNELLTTGDVDLLWDTRQGLSLAVKGFHRAGVLGYLKRADSSFRRGKHQNYRAVNWDGFMVNLISPVNEVPSDADNPEDLIGARTEGLEWLVNTPKVNGVVIGADGLPLRCWSVDPRAFALHKAWVSQRIDRDPLRRARDLAHAREVAGIAKHYLGMRFSNPDLSALPVFMRQFADQFDDG